MLVLGAISTFWSMTLSVYSLTIEINLELYRVAIKKKIVFWKN